MSGATGPFRDPQLVNEVRTRAKQEGEAGNTREAEQLHTLAEILDRKTPRWYVWLPAWFIALGSCATAVCQFLYLP